MAEHNDLGKWGEALAVAFLQEKKHEILARNYQFNRAEIDIISKIENTLVFTEVKTRSSNFFDVPEMAISEQKKQKLYEGAEQFLLENQLENAIRFDVIAITKVQEKTEIHHIEDAFFG